jgi:hypothetical protein
MEVHPKPSRVHSADAELMRKLEEGYAAVAVFSDDPAWCAGACGAWLTAVPQGSATEAGDPKVRQNPGGSPTGC